ncbi:hypothetical protein A0G03_06540 [Pectobacterium peruviense]|uniref:Transcriptional regulator n=1 Tax=Pectobacterium peruviense TaxID=2066479 RepID=A0ABX4S963_9GAMM|nr:hypothetical protein G033_02515 [Pectobacterium peruviense]PKX87102.1 hypothetical protein A0G03_06540 [Pectobacterium peruviense]
MSRRDAAKACATSGTCRKRSVKPDADEGIAQRHNLAKSQGSQGDGAEPPCVGRVLRGSMKMTVLWRTKLSPHSHKI